MFFKVYFIAIGLAVPIFIWTGNTEFLFYAAVISLFVGFLWFTDRFFHFRKTSLSLFFAWLIIHVCGGSVPIGEGKVLYDWIIVPLVPAPYSIFKFDQFAHFFCYLAIGMLADDAIAPLLKPQLPKAARFLVVVLAAIGIGALNEVMEFAAVCMIPNTNVGDYTNNALDLVFNTLGALTAATVRLKNVTLTKGEKYERFVFDSRARGISVFLFALLVCCAIGKTNAPPASVAAADQRAENAIVAAARSQVGKTVTYDSGYVRLTYPMGDVPIEKGVCTDVIIRALRVARKMDLQQLVHEDMTAAFSAYPNNWGLKSPDRNIDHRRVPNLKKYFERKGFSVAVSKKLEDYLPGDFVTCTVAGNRPHIMIVSDRKTPQGVPLIIHNIGSGTREEDSLFAFPITGHYRIK